SDLSLRRKRAYARIARFTRWDRSGKKRARSFTHGHLKAHATLTVSAAISSPCSGLPTPVNLYRSRKLIAHHSSQLTMRSERFIPHRQRCLIGLWNSAAGPEQQVNPVTELSGGCRRA